MTSWATEAPYPVASSGGSTPVTCSSPTPAAVTPVAECQTAYDVHRLAGFTVPAVSVLALVLVAVLLVVFGAAVRRG